MENNDCNGAGPHVAGECRIYGEETGGFNVIRTWSNWDSIHEEIVSPEPFATRDAALEDAIRRRQEHERQYRLPSSAFIVRPVSEGVHNTYFEPRGER